MQQKQFGRTFWDVIAENYKLIFWLVIILIIALFVLSIFGKPFKFGNVEIGIQPVPEKTTLRDTIIKHDTIYVPTISKKSSIKKIESQPSIQVKSDNQQGGQTAGYINNN